MQEVSVAPDKAAVSAKTERARGRFGACMGGKRKIGKGKVGKVCMSASVPAVEGGGGAAGQGREAGQGGPCVRRCPADPGPEAVRPRSPHAVVDADNAIMVTLSCQRWQQICVSDTVKRGGGCYR
ncbi:hypothetical protein GCM10027570_16540 [Streptomonospora sediminis]